jgi:uncharacterized membrane protein SpoIIM required for sporulation
MSCEALLIVGIAGLALTAGALAFQSLTGSNKKREEKAKLKQKRLAAAVL